MEKYIVYILQSEIDESRFYVGITELAVKERLQYHNRGQVSHTSKYRPWRIKTYTVFSDKARAFAFEKYLKTHSGRAFAKKRL